MYNVDTVLLILLSLSLIDFHASSFMKNCKVLRHVVAQISNVGGPRGRVGKVAEFQGS